MTTRFEPISPSTAQRLSTAINALTLLAVVLVAIVGLLFLAPVALMLFGLDGY